MTDDDLEQQTKARRVLVEMRHGRIKTIAAGYQRGKTEDAIKGLIEVQQAIDVIDRAVDEFEEEDEDVE